MTPRFLVAVFVLAGAGTLAGQYPRLDGRASPAVVAAVVPLLDSARAAGLPTEPLEAKVLEGVTKGATAERIAAVVRQLSANLGLARRLLGSEASARELAAGAWALRAGVTPAALEQFRAARRSRDIAVAIEVATDLIARAVPPDTASRIVLRALAAGVSDGDLEQLRIAVERDVASGVPPPVAASLRSRVLLPQGPL